MTMVVTTAQVREYLELNADSSTSRYSEATIGSNIRAAQWQLEYQTHRFLVDHPAQTWKTTSMIAAQWPIPGFRSFTSVTWGNTAMVVDVNDPTNASIWAIPDELMTGVYVALQVRPWRADQSEPWWLADRLWWDKMLDSPFAPMNRGGGFNWTSMPNDVVVVGDAGYAPGAEPEIVLHVVKVLAAFFTMRSSSILADTAITPAGGVLTYSQWPSEVRQFVADWKLGSQVKSM